MLERELGERLPVRDVGSIALRDPGERPIHGTRVQVPKAEPPREHRRDGALPRTGRPVDRHDHVAGG